MICGRRVVGVCVRVRARFVLVVCSSPLVLGFSITRSHLCVICAWFVPGLCVRGLCAFCAWFVLGSVVRGLCAVCARRVLFSFGSRLPY